MEPKLRESEVEQKRLREENERPCARSLVPLLSAMKDFPTELMQRMIPADRAIMLGMVSNEMRAAMGRVKPAARVKGQASRGPASRSRGKCRASARKYDAQRGGKHGARKALQTALIKPIALLERGLGNLQEWCRVTALDLSAIEIGDEGAGRLATVLPQSTSLAQLHLGSNVI